MIVYYVDMALSFAMLGKMKSVMMILTQSASLYLLSQLKVRYAQENNMAGKYPSLEKGFNKRKCMEELVSFIPS